MKWFFQHPWKHDQKKRERSEERGRSKSSDRNLRKRESTPGVSLKRVTNNSPARKSPRRQRSGSDSTPLSRSPSCKTMHRVKVNTPANKFQEEPDMFNDNKIETQRTFNRSTKPKRLNSKPPIRRQKMTSQSLPKQEIIELPSHMKFQCLMKEWMTKKMKRQRLMIQITN